MNWRLIFALLPIPIFQATLLILGVSNVWIFLGWLFWYIFSAMLIARNEFKRWFLTAVVVGILWGIVNNLMEFTFYDTYLANSPGVEESFNNPDYISPRMWILMIGPLIGLGLGLIVGVFTWLVRATIFRSKIRS